MGGVAQYVFADAQHQAAAAAHAQVQWANQGLVQGLDISNLHALQVRLLPSSNLILVPQFSQTYDKTDLNAVRYSRLQEFPAHCDSDVVAVVK